MVAGEDDAGGAADGNPASGLEGLGGLVDEEGAELHSFKQSRAGADEGAGDDAGLSEDVAADADGEFGLAALQSLQFLVAGCAAALVGPHLADGLAYGPELRIVGMGLEAPLIGEAQHLVVDARWIADAQHVDATVDELFANPVDGGVALCAHQHLALAHQHLVDGLHEGRCLARSWWSVHHFHVLGLQHFVDGLLLRGVEPGEAHRLERELSRRLVAVEEVAQVGQTVVLGMDDAVEGIEHHAVGGLVEEKLHADGIGRTLNVELMSLGNDHHHAVAVDIAHLGREGEIAYGAVLLHGEEHHGLAEFEVVGDVGVGGARHLNRHLVECVVGAAAHGEGKPRVATLHLAAHAHGLRLLSVGFLLHGVFHLEQGALLQQRLYR